MKPPPFEYHAPETVEEALALLSDHGDEAKVLAGGQSLIPLLSLRLARPSHLVDVGGLAELRQVRSDGALVLGAAVTQRAAERSPDVRASAPLLAGTLPLVGHEPIRTRGTIGGSLAHADPAAELPAVACALEATLVARGPGGERTIAAADFFLGYLTTALADDELLTEVRLPATGAGTGWACDEVARRHGDFALAAAFAVVRVDQAGAVSYARLALAGVADTPVRARTAEAALAGQPAHDTTWEAAGHEAARGLDPPSDVHASGAYRRHVAGVLTRRALSVAAGRATAGTR